MVEHFVWKWEFELPEKCNIGLQSFGTVFLCTAGTIISISPSYLKVRSTCWNTGKMLSPCSFWCIVASFYPFASTYLILICKLKASRCNENAPSLSSLNLSQCYHRGEGVTPSPNPLHLPNFLSQIDHHSQSNTKYGLSQHHFSPTIKLS